MTTTQPARFAHTARQRGILLIYAAIALVVLAIASIAMLRSVDTGTLVAGNMGLKQASISASDVGLETGRLALQTLVDANATEAAAANYSPLYDPTITIPVALTAATANPVSNVGGIGNDARYWIERMCSAAGAASPATCHITPGASTPYFRTTVRVDGLRGTTTFAQAMLSISAGIGYAIMAHGNLKLDSSVNVLSTQQAGDVYSGGNVELSNNTHVAGTIEAQSYSGSLPAEGEIVIPAPVQPVPDFRPATYQKYARYRLGNDCRVYQRTGGTINSPSETALTSAGAAWFGWKCDTSPSAKKAPSEPPSDWTDLVRWKLENDDSTSTDLLYVEGRVLVSSSPGWDPSKPGPTPWVISIIATGDIDISGNTKMLDFRGGMAWDGTTPIPPTVNDIMFLAGVDLKMGGTVEQTGTEALFTARDHVWLSGTTTLKGTLISTQLWNHNGLLDKTGISGTTQITYSGGLGGSNTATYVAWREIK